MHIARRTFCGGAKLGLSQPWFLSLWVEFSSKFGVIRSKYLFSLRLREFVLAHDHLKFFSPWCHSFSSVVRRMCVLIYNIGPRPPPGHGPRHTGIHTLFAVLQSVIIHEGKTIHCCLLQDTRVCILSSLPSWRFLEY